MNFNEVEALHEIVITPDDLRDIANEMERKSKNEFFQHGQIIRYKFNHLFCFVFKPEKKSVKTEEVTVSEEVVQ